MRSADYYNDLCNWWAFYPDERLAEAALERHAELHERQEHVSIAVDSTLRRAARLGFSGLSERERDIIRAYNAGAYPA